MSETSFLETLRPIVRQAFSACRLDFLRWALPQCRTDEHYTFANALAQAIGDVSFAEAQDAFTRKLAEEGPIPSKS